MQTAAQTLRQPGKVPEIGSMAGQQGNDRFLTKVKAKGGAFG